jgi:hypothetical protein
MKPRKIRKRQKRKNPAKGLKLDEEIFKEVVKDQIITRNFGLVGLAISYGNDRLRNFLASSFIIKNGEDETNKDN